MKKERGISLIALTIIIVAILVVGGVVVVLVMNKDNTQNNTNETFKVENNLVNNEQLNNLTTEDTTVQTDEYEGIAYVGSRAITINYKTGRRKDTKSSSIVFHNEKTYLSVLTYDKEETFSGTLDNVFNLLNDGRIFKDISTLTGSCFTDSKKTYLINKVSEKKLKIGDVDTIQFEGNVLDEKEINCYIYGYTFIMDNTPCMLVGCVFSEKQESSSISGMHEEVDTMMATARNE